MKYAFEMGTVAVIYRIHSGSFMYSKVFREGFFFADVEWRLNELTFREVG
jgi:hypothetical protein